MKRLNQLPANTFLKLFFTYFSLCFLVGACCMPDRADMLAGFWRILSNPTKASTNFFSVGGYAATFLNMGLVGLICTGLYCIPGDKADHAATLVTILTTSFGAWGIHVLNMWPTMFGVMLYCWRKKKPLGNYTNAMLFSTGLAPFVSELMLRYPDHTTIGFTPLGVFFALVMGIFVGMFLPAGLDHSPRIHKGMAIYSAALPVGMTAFLLQGFLYKAIGVELPPSVGDLHVASATIVNSFCLVVFVSFILIAYGMGARLKDHFTLMKDPGHVKCVTAQYGNATFLLNAGCYGLYVLLYYNLIGAEFNGITLGIIFGMLSTCNAGSHPGNVWPFMTGYAIASHTSQLLAYFTGGTFAQPLNAQAMMVGLCFANGLTPISDTYGWRYGMAAAVLHYYMVTTVPNLHGGFCLYNGGFTAALVCILLIPPLEHHFRPKHERPAKKRRKKASR